MRRDAIRVSAHALNRWNERVVGSNQPPVTADEISDIVRKHVRGRGSVMRRRGKGYVLFSRGLKIIVTPEEFGWAVLTVWPLGGSKGGSS